MLEIGLVECFKRWYQRNNLVPVVAPLMVLCLYDCGTGQFGEILGFVMQVAAPRMYLYEIQIAELEMAARLCPYSTGHIPSLGFIGS